MEVSPTNKEKANSLGQKQILSYPVYRTKFAKAQGKGRPIVIGTCYQFLHCNQTCVESDFSGGKCVPLPPARIDFGITCSKPRLIPTRLSIRTHSYRREEFAKAQGIEKPIIIGTSTEVPHCKQKTCIKAKIFGGNCVPLPPPYNNFVIHNNYK
ncbi:hypothetical protein YC2023_095739 [Brassica napus]